jgi:hypothetical protein
MPKNVPKSKLRMNKSRRMRIAFNIFKIKINILTEKIEKPMNPWVASNSK